jgi:hypothetical protein
MINLIPPAFKRSVTIEYWTRVTSVCLFILSGILFASTLLLLPVYVRINLQIDTFEKAANEALERVSQHDLSSATLVKTGTKARLLLELRNDTKFSSIISLLQEMENSQVFIESIDFTRVDTGIGPMQLSGKALTRQSLADFRTALLARPEIDSVLLPISNLAQDKDISFSVTITMKNII